MYIALSEFVKVAFLSIMLVLSRILLVCGFAVSAASAEVSVSFNRNHDKLLNGGDIFNIQSSSQLIKQIQQPATNSGISSFENTIETASSVNQTLDYIEASGNEFQKLDACDKFFYQHDDLGQKYTLHQFSYLAMIAKHLSMVYTDTLIHRYDTYEDLKSASGPDVDQEACLSQLNFMVKRTEILSKERFYSRYLNMFQIMDTFGRPPPGILVGSSAWLGQYDECIRLQIQGPQENDRWPTRYCMASLKLSDWPQAGPMSEDLVVKAGVCIPKTCDSANYKNKYELIRQLYEFNSRRMDVNQTYMHSLYCLPDEDSPLRSIRQSSKSLATATGFGIWIAILIYATIKYELYKSEKKRVRREEKLAQGRTPSPDSRCVSPLEETKAVGLTMGFEIKNDQTGMSSNGSVGTPIKHNSRYIKIYKSLSIFNNLKLLFNTSKSSALMEKAKADGDEQTGETADEHVQSLLAKEPIVDLRPLEGIKVICMAYVIMGHVLMCLTMVIKNGRDLAVSTSPSFFIANLVPAFAVNSFFTITGLLTSYLLFKQNKSHSLFGSPSKWIAFMLYRYLRIMPMYVIVILYTKFIARYMGSGPIWDYGTSAASQRKICENESWFWTLAFAANFKPPLDHCVPSAWYLANDFQFFVVTPIFLYTLYKRPQLGQLLLKVGIAAGYIAGFLSIMTSGVDDLRPVARFMPHGFKTYVSNLSFNYTRPQYRIPAYFCGLLVGFLLHQYEQDKVKWIKRRYEESQKEAARVAAAAKKKADQMTREERENDDDIPIEEDVELCIADSAIVEDEECSESSRILTPDISPPLVVDGAQTEAGNGTGQDESLDEPDEKRPSQVEKGEPASASSGQDEPNVEPVWPSTLTEHGVTISLLFIFACCITPLIGSRLPFNKFFAKLLVAIIMPSYHVLFSLSIGIYLLLATTGYGNKTLNGMLAAPIWKPLSRLSLCAVLINVEVINYLVQLSSETKYINTQFQFSLDLFAIVCTYLVATVTCVLFEAPMRAALNHLLGYVLSKLARKRKTH